jgi:hypothetical protein
VRPLQFRIPNAVTSIDERLKLLMDETAGIMKTSLQGQGGYVDDHWRVVQHDLKLQIIDKLCKLCSTPTEEQTLPNWDVQSRS